MLSLLVESGRYRWHESGVGVLCIVVGVLLVLDYRGSANRIRDPRARWGRIFGGTGFGDGVASSRCAA
jgi:hypothetical protein